MRLQNRSARPFASSWIRWAIKSRNALPIAGRAIPLFGNICISNKNAPNSRFKFRTNKLTYTTNRTQNKPVFVRNTAYQSEME